MVYRQLVADAKLTEHPAEHDPAGLFEKSIEAGPGGHSGASTTSSAADLHTRSSALRISHNPNPHPRRYPPHGDPAHPPRLRLPSPRAGSPEPSRWSAPPDERP
jgi:hypothetical protein